MKLMLFIFMLIVLLNFIESNLILMFMFNLIFILSLLFMISFNYSMDWGMIYNFMGLDKFSMILILLSLWIIGLMFISSVKFKFLKLYSLNLLILLLFLVMSFLSMNYFMFYLFFEMSLIPTFFLIMGWGYQPDRISASMYMLLYTIFASLPLLVLNYYLFDMFNSLNYLLILNNSINLGNLLNFIFYFFMLFAFLVKLPLFMFHIWLPKAHIEAPVTGSMILAGVLLKLGGYGVMRSMMMMINLVNFNYLFFCISLIGMVYLSLLSLRCHDMKLIVAYSSVVHMGMMLLGLMTMSMVGYFGGFLMMIGHGICSSGMFLLVNYVYEQTKSRSLLLNKGLISLMPSLSMWWFMFCVINMSAPISLNLMSEILILISLFNWSMKIIIFLFLGMYFSAMYSLYLFSYSQHGLINNCLLKISSNKIQEFQVLMMHWILLNLLILKMEMFF